ncbi:MAG: hypothetical protein LBD88_00385 [Candidatus Peribacteria bacterium]|jgi:hypothetical protein|nr:hypothetical protein [Candidatus Peribacteria bacterium]
MSGIALFTEISSIINPLQSTFAILQMASFLISTSPLKVEIHHHFERDFETTFELVFFQI